MVLVCCTSKAFITTHAVYIHIEDCAVALKVAIVLTFYAKVYLMFYMTIPTFYAKVSNIHVTIPTFYKVSNVLCDNVLTRPVYIYIYICGIY